MKATIIRVLALALFLLPAIASLPAGAAPSIVEPGTVTINVGNETFTVTTDQPIQLDLLFTSPSVLEGSVVVTSGDVANVTVFWRKAGVTVFTGRVTVCTRFRYDVPQRYNAQEDAGHNEK
jgi:hypothetical protein